jgi:hypothetical protein
MEIEYFRDIDSETLFSPVGTSGFNGIFRLRSGSNTWEFLSPGSLEWDRVHQKIYRAARVEKIDPRQLSFSLPSLPVLTQHDAQYKTWNDNLLPKHQIMASDYPLTKEIIEARENKQITVFVVLTEDTYDTFLGDGKFLYLKEVFLSKVSANQYINHKRKEGVQFHLRTITIRLDGEAFSFPSFEAYEYDHHKAEDVLRSLESHFGK